MITKDEQKKKYSEWIKSCSSYLDIDKWFKEGFHFSSSREKHVWTRISENVSKCKEQSSLEPILSHILKPYEVFTLRYGSCVDICWFVGKSLELINPSYCPTYNTIVTKRGQVVHTLVLFKDPQIGKLFTIDYSFPEWIPEFKMMCGLWGPFEDLSDVVYNFYLALNPKYKEVETFYPGWPRVEHLSITN